MRLPAIGFTLPWQLVAAHDPGPMYFPVPSFSAARPAGSALPHKTQPAHTSARSHTDVFAILIRGPAQTPWLLSLPAKLRPSQCLFRPLRRKANYQPHDRVLHSNQDGRIKAHHLTLRPNGSVTNVGRCFTRDAP